MGCGLSILTKLKERAEVACLDDSDFHRLSTEQGDVAVTLMIDAMLYERALSRSLRLTQDKRTCYIPSKDEAIALMFACGVDPDWVRSWSKSRVGIAWEDLKEYPISPGVVELTDGDIALWQLRAYLRDQGLRFATIPELIIWRLRLGSPGCFLVHTEVRGFPSVELVDLRGPREDDTGPWELIGGRFTGTWPDNWKLSDFCDIAYSPSGGGFPKVLVVKM